MAIEFMLNDCPGILYYKGQVNTYTELPNDGVLADVYQTIDTQTFYMLKTPPSGWVTLGSGGSIADLSGYYTKEEVDSLIASNGALTQEDINSILSQLQTSLGSYMTQTEIDSMIASIQDQLNNGYITKDEADQIVDDALSQSLTADQVQEMIDASMSDISNDSYVTEDELTSSIQTVMNQVNNQTRKNVTSLFTISPVVEDVQVWLDDDKSGTPQIIIRGDYITDTPSDITITAPYGMGSKFNFIGNTSKVVTGWNATSNAAGFYPVTISGETSVIQTVITVPAEVTTFEVFYFVRPAGANDPLLSYWVDTDNISHIFSQFDTPITNFCKSSSVQTTTITINGQQVQKGQIKEIHFGDDYGDIKTISNTYFCFAFNSCSLIDIRGLKSLVSTASYALDHEDALTTVKMNLPNFTTPNVEWMCYCDQLTEIDLSSMINLTSVSTGFYYGCDKLKTVRIGTNAFSKLTNPTAAYLFGGGLNNTADVTLIAADQATANAFKAKFSSKASNWTVQIEGV